jgi:glycosyltransferase involved in cell wall biosynthesis
MVKLSIVIPTLDRAEYLARLLDSIGRQTVSEDRFEVIVVDNGSVDETREVVTSYENKIRNITYVYEATPGLHECRHAGYSVSKADIVVYADDDIEAFPTWLEGIEESFADRSVVAVGGKCLPRFDASPPEWLLQMWDEKTRGSGGNVLSYLSIIDLGERKRMIRADYIFGCNMSLRKSVILEAGGFHPDSMPSSLMRFRGDGETHVMNYINKKGYAALYNPKASVYHAVPASRMTREYFCQRAFRQGLSDSYTSTRAHLLGEGPSLGNRILTKTRRLAGLTIKSIRKTSNNELTKAIERGYSEGYKYHKAEVAKDAELRDWVKRKTYFSEGTDG